METKASRLIRVLQSCPKGKEGWRDYESVVGEILEYLFVPPLGKPINQPRNENGLHIMDFILYIPYYVKNFWFLPMMKHDSIALVVECKNKKRLNPNDIQVASKYLKEKGLGTFGLLLTREKPSDHVIEQLLEVWKEKEKKLFVILDDEDLIEMITLKTEEKEPETLIDKRIFEYRVRL